MAKSKKKKSSGAKSAVRKPARKLHARKTGHKTPVRTKKTARRSPKSKLQSSESAAAVLLGLNNREKKLDPFVRKQKQKLLQLRDAVVDSMAGVAQGTLRSRAEGSEASAFGMHQADAGSDAYDRDFALSLLSQEQDALYEIDEALKRIELGTYGKSGHAEKAGEGKIQSFLGAAPKTSRDQIASHAAKNAETSYRISSRESAHAATPDRHRHRSNRLQES